MSEDQAKLTYIFQSIRAALDTMSLDEFLALDDRFKIIDHIFKNYDYYHYLDQGVAMHEAIAQCKEDHSK